MLRKRRHHVKRAGMHIVVDQLEDGTLLAKVDGGDLSPAPVPDWLDVVADVSTDERRTGQRLATD